MHCASCVVLNEDSLKGVPGVTDASVNFALKQATVTFDEAKVQLHDLHQAVRKAGYSVPMQDSHDGHGDHMSHMNAGIIEARRAATFGLIAAIPVVALGMFGWEFGQPLAGVMLSMWLMALVSAFVILVLGRQFHKGMVNEISHLRPGMDSLVSLGTLAALGFSAWAMFAGEHVYFETGAIITALILLGKYLEARSTGQAGEAITKLMQLGVKHAKVLRNGEEVVVPIEQLAVDDVVVVRPGEKVPSDGVIVKGAAALDESMLTGESIPADKSAGDKVFGATLNTNGLINVRVERVGEGTVLAQIVKLVADAQTHKAPIQKLADRMSGIFVPVVLVVSVVTAAVWLLVGGGMAQALTAAVAVLVIACPCALGLATPTAIMVGTGLGAKRGILVKNGEALERAKRIDVMVFDKTGTLTYGTPEVAHLWAVPGNDELAVLQLAASVEHASEHPVAQAVVRQAALANNTKLKAVEDFQAVAGGGVVGKVHGVGEVCVGTLKFLQERSVDIDKLVRVVDDRQSKGETAFGVALSGKAIGVVSVADAVRKDAKGAIAELRRLNIEAAIISGDHQRTVEAVARELGISVVLAEVLPSDKALKVRELQGRGKRVAFVGDGINDAPALAQADLGVAMGSGTDIAMAAGSIVLMQSSPMKAVEALALSRRTFRAIQQNLFWAFAYNIAAVPLAALGLLSPMIAAAAMAASSVSVVGNSLRIRQAK